MKNEKSKWVDNVFMSVLRRGRGAPAPCLTLGDRACID
jgi:hypothetical protein